MFRMTLTLVAAIYAGFVIYGQPSGSEAATGPQPDAAVPVVAAVGSEAGFDRPTILAQGEARPEAAVARAQAPDLSLPDPVAVAAATPAAGPPTPRLIGEPITVSLVREIEAQPAAATPRFEEAVPLLTVTGSRVNMRAGPSTADGVVDSLPRGTLAEALGPAVDGWQEIRDTETGLTGFMAARFLDPA
jgi:hypothetical protein